MIKSLSSLMKSLPHSYPFILIDRVIELEESISIICLKNITVNDALLKNYLGKDPVLPPILIVEAMAQTSGILISGYGPEMTYLSLIRDAKFYKPVSVGDQLIITSTLSHKLPPLYFFEVKASVGAETVSEAKIALSQGRNE